MGVSPVSFGSFFIKGFFRLCIFLGSMTIAPDESCPPTAKLNLNQTLTLTREQFSLGAIFWLPPNPKTNPDLDPNPTLTGGQFSSGGQLSGYHFLLRNLYIYARNITNIVDV